MQRSNSTSTENLTSIKRNRPYLIFEKICSLHNGDIIKVPPFGTVRLIPVEYDHLIGLLHTVQGLSSFAFRFLKLSYSQRKRRLAYQMERVLHSDMTSIIKGSISDQLYEMKKRCKKNPNIPKFIAERSNGNFGKMKGGPDQRVLDALWRFTKASGQQYCFFLELAFSQSGPDAQEKIMDLLHRGKGRPALALLVEVAYATPEQVLKDLPRDMTATYSLFQYAAKTNSAEKNDIIAPYHVRVFRNADGSTEPGRFSFSLGDMLGPKHRSEDCLADIDPLDPVYDEKFIFDHAEIADWLHDAEETERREEHGQQQLDSSSPNHRVPSHPASLDTSSQRRSSSDESSESSYEPSNDGKDPTYKP